jgi:hypothetical protein
VLFVAINLSATHLQKQRANDRDHDQEFDQGKSGSSRSVHDVTLRVGVGAGLHEIQVANQFLAGGKAELVQRRLTVRITVKAF